MKRIAAFATIATLCMLSPASAEEMLECTDTDGNGFKWDEQGNAKRSGFTPTRFTVEVFSGTEGQSEIDRLTEQGALSTPEPNATLRMIHWQDEAYPFPYLCNRSSGRHIQNCHAPYGRFHARPISFGEKGYTRAFLLGTPLGRDTEPWIMVYHGTCSKL